MRHLIVLLSSLFLMGCQAADLPQRHLIVAGSPSLTPLAKEIAERFQRDHPAIRIDITSAGADEVIGDTRQGLVDVALVGRSLRASETDLQGAVIAQDGIAFIVHRSNPVPPPDERQLVSLLTRTYTDWREVGGSAGPVHVFGLAEGLGLRDTLLSRLKLDKRSVRLDPPLYLGEQVIEAVANNPAGLGFVSLAEARKEGAVQSIRVLPMAGVGATVENVRTGLYPYTRPVLMAARLQGDEMARQFIEFASSAAVHDLLELHGFAPAPP